MSEAPCRLTVSLKRPAEPPPLRVSVSDTGVGSNLEEFLELDVLAHEAPVEKWDGTLLITTTGINDDAIYRYKFNLQEAISNARFTKLATTYKNHATFRGTEVCLYLSNEYDADDFISWLVGFIRKIYVLRVGNLACEILIEQTGSAETRTVCLPHDYDDAQLSLTTSIIDRPVSGLKDYSIWTLTSHGYVPGLAQSIAGLIMSSNDREFHEECITFLGLSSDQDISEAEVTSSIVEKMTRIIEMNDTNENVEDSAPYLFGCEEMDEGTELYEEGGNEDLGFDF